MMRQGSRGYGLGLALVLFLVGTASAAESVTLPALDYIPLGVVGHDNNAAYPDAQMEQRLQLLDRYNLRSYRSGEFLLLDLPRMDRLVALARQYHITLRPVITQQLTQAQAYALAKRYAGDIKIWEIGNEQDHSRVGAGIRISRLVDIYRGIRRASDELGANLQTTINVMACNPYDTGPKARCPGERSGSLWFLEQAKAAGFDFDFISFHYYPHYHDRGRWMDLYLGQMRAMAEKYRTQVFFNEANCGEIYNGTTDGGRPGDLGCYDSLEQLLSELNGRYRDVVREINLYELLDEPTHPVLHERHFGLLYDLQRPKPVMALVRRYAGSP
ncbi:glycosyl hydrolase 53 family protein [uncultured Pseudomonas sp.]|uniref:glycosyl hydrolase 53 family protein n=1 Tax=uncultured Pseudomonas sp. TaxID=114707 RepID=UPI0025F05E89|nr:glycosyl hydrolase 53 family protein [uncultured Pseudomonas sp.]